MEYTGAERLGDSVDRVVAEIPHNNAGEVRIEVREQAPLENPSNLVVRPSEESQQSTPSIDNVSGDARGSELASPSAHVTFTPSTSAPPVIIQTNPSYTVTRPLHAGPGRSESNAVDVRALPGGKSCLL